VLPDLPSFKRDLFAILIRYLRNATHQRLGAFSDVPRHVVHEGKDMRVQRSDGSVEDFGMKGASAEMLTKVEDIPHMSLEDRIKQLDELAHTMAKQMSQHMYESLTESLEKAGQVVDARGKPLDIETIFEVLEKVEMDFDSQGNLADGFRFVVGPALIPRIREMMEQEKNDPTIKRRREAIMAKKWLAWRDREATRKLVG
jgi:hypothetical protein